MTASEERIMSALPTESSSLSLLKMCYPHTTHALAAIIGLDHTLKIEFPHSAWAYAFRDHVNSREYHRRSRTNARIDAPEFRVVHLWLPRSLRAVEVKEGVLGVK